MLPLTYAELGEEGIISRISGTADEKKRMEQLGVHVGCRVKLISLVGTDFILNVNDARIAIGRELAEKIMI
ncbi:MAG: ferrous iron transport protein A [Clostridia bacterium]|nr:ferrous iron transport protein A [Clostridia bacterium]